MAPRPGQLNCRIWAFRTCELGWKYCDPNVLHLFIEHSFIDRWFGTCIKLLLICNLDLDLERVVGGPLHEPEKLTDVVSISDEVDVSDIKFRAIDREGAKEGLERKAGVARGVLINEGRPRIRGQLEGD